MLYSRKGCARLPELLLNKNSWKKYVALHILEKHFNNKCKLKRKSVIDFAVYRHLALGRQFPAFLFHTYSHKPKRRFCAIFHVFSLCFHNRTLGLFSLYRTFLLISFFPFFSVLPGSQRLSVNSPHFSDPRSFPATTEYLLPIRHVLLKQERRGRARLQCRRGREKKIKAGREGGATSGTRDCLAQREEFGGR